MSSVLPSPQGGGMWREESAEAIVARRTTGEGPNFVLRKGAFAVRVREDIGGRAEKRGAAVEDTGRNPGEGPRGMSRHPMAGGSPVPEQVQLMERVVKPSNMQAALKRVKQNKGAPGVDAMSADQLGPFLHTDWPKI